MFPGSFFRLGIMFKNLPAWMDNVYLPGGNFNHLERQQR